MTDFCQFIRVGSEPSSRQPAWAAGSVHLWHHSLVSPQGQISDQGPTVPGAAGASRDKLLPFSGGTDPNRRRRERGETEAAGIGMGWMWGPGVMRPRDAGVGMPGQEMGQEERQEPTPIISAPSKHSHLENDNPATPLPKYTP